MNEANEANEMESLKMIKMVVVCWPTSNGQRQIELNVHGVHALRTGATIGSNLFWCASRIQHEHEHDFREIYISLSNSINFNFQLHRNSNGNTPSPRHSAQSNRVYCAMQHYSGHISSSKCWIRFMRASLSRSLLVVCLGCPRDLYCHWLSTPKNTLNFLSNHHHHHQQRRRHQRQDRRPTHMLRLTLLHSIYFPIVRSLISVRCDTPCTCHHPFAIQFRCQRYLRVRSLHRLKLTRFSYYFLLCVFVPLFALFIQWVHIIFFFSARRRRQSLRPRWHRKKREEITIPCVWIWWTSVCLLINPAKCTCNLIQYCPHQRAHTHLCHIKPTKNYFN